MSVRRSRRFHPAALGAFLALLLIACDEGGAGTATRPPAPMPSPFPISPLAAPTAGLASSPTGLSYARTLTDADNGATIPVAVGDQIALTLQVPPGSDPWQVEPPDTRVLVPIPNPAAAAVGVTLRAYRAAGPGQAAISATSRPHCDPGAACPGLIRGFRVTVIVATP